MNAERLLVLFDRVADAPDAIPRLRRFVLDLAVRGKLVPQDPADGPAIRFDRTIPEDLERPFKIPSHWNWSRVAALGKFKGGGTPSKAQADFWSGTIPWVSPKDMKVDYIADAQLHITEAALANSATSLIEAGSILFVVRGMILAHSFPVSMTQVPVAINQDMKALIPKRPEMAEFLLRAFKGVTPGVLKRVERSTHGTCRLEGASYSELLIPIPPLAEQHRIVTKVDELMALCDRLEAARATREAARDRLSAASLARLNTPDPETFQADARFALDALPVLARRADQMKALRQTILNLAVRGKLVPQDTKDEPASELLERIAKERAGPQAAKKARRNGEIDVANLRADMPLAIGWRWTTLDEVALSMRYGTSTKCEYASPGVPVLRIPNVSDGVVSLDDIKFGPLTETEIRELALSAGDLLMIRSNGSLDIVGRSAVVTAAAEGMAFAGYLVRVRLSMANIYSEYIWLALNSTDVRDQIERPIRSAVGLKNVNLSEFGALTFPLPPFAEQRRIIAKVTELMALSDRLQESLAASDASRSRLLNALLAAALAPIELERAS